MFLNHGKLDGDAIIKMPNNLTAQGTEEDERPDWRARLCRHCCTGKRQINDSAGVQFTAWKLYRAGWIVQHHTFVPPIIAKVELMTVGQPGKLRCQHVAFALRCSDRHGKTAIHEAGDAALDAPNVIEVSDNAFSGSAGPFGLEGNASWRHVEDAARMLGSVLEHVTPEQRDLHALESSSFRMSRRRNCRLAPRHFSHPARYRPVGRSSALPIVG